MRLFYLLLILLSAPALAATDNAAPANRAPDPTTNAATQENRDAARLEQQDLRDREKALRQQQHTTKTLLDKQAQYLQALRQRIQHLKQHNTTASPR